eukprot:6457821-Amphidinium_carterae.5
MFADGVEELMNVEVDLLECVRNLSCVSVLVDLGDDRCSCGLIWCATNRKGVLGVEQGGCHWGGAAFQLPSNWGLCACRRAITLRSTVKGLWSHPR